MYIFRIEVTLRYGCIMYIILPIIIVVLVVSWLQLRRLSRIWAQRPVNAYESIIAGIAAWLFLFSILAWLCGIILLCIQVFSSYDITDIMVLIFAILLTGFVLNFYKQSRSELQYDETMDFWKEALQFRRSEQRRLDVLSLMQKERERKQKKKNTAKDSILHERILLQANLDREKEQETQLALLRNGASINLNELWHTHTQTHSSHPLFEKIQEARIDPNKKRLFLHADFSELNEEKLKDDTVVLRLNRQVYDFFQFVNAEPWLKPYTPYYKCYFLICRALKKMPDSTEILYPFMKVEVSVSELRNLEGSYFNPRKLSEIATLTFNGGAQV